MPPTASKSQRRFFNPGEKLLIVTFPSNLFEVGLVSLKREVVLRERMPGYLFPLRLCELLIPCRSLTAFTHPGPHAGPALPSCCCLVEASSGTQGPRKLAGHMAHRDPGPGQVYVDLHFLNHQPGTVTGFFFTRSEQEFRDHILYLPRPYDQPPHSTEAPRTQSSRSQPSRPEWD